MPTWNLLVLFVFVLFICGAASGRTAIRNFRKGDANNSIDAHDGPIIQLKDPTNGNKLTFYRFAMAYTKCVLSGGETGTKFPRLRNFLRRSLNRFIEFATPSTHSGFDCAPIVTTWLSEGFGNDCGFKNPANGQSVLVHKSTDLKNWIYVGDALADAPAWVREHSIIFRPAILRHPVTGKLVLWLNRLPRLGEKNVVESYKKSGFIVGVENAGNPEKPFTFVSSEAEGMIKMAHAGGADFSLLQDDDGNAYIAYGAWHNFKINEGWKARYYPDWMKEGHQIAVQKLDKQTYAKLEDVKSSVTITTQEQEAPAFFKRNGFYYIIHGDLCCFCAKGSDAKVVVSRNPLGPYTYLTNLNPKKHLEPDQSGQQRYSHSHIQAQNSDVIEVRDASGNTTYIWSADLWFSAASGFKGDDLQYWQPINFVEQGSVGDTTSAPVPTRNPSTWTECFELDLSHMNNNQDRCEDDHATVGRVRTDHEL